MRRRRRAEEQNLDSLLDTMANVVGILVVLVAVTQLSVGDAVERLRDAILGRVVSEEKVERADQEVLETAEALAQARQQWLSALSGDNESAWIMEDAEKIIERLEALAGPNELSSADSERLGEEVEQRAAALASRESDMKKRRSSAAALDAILSGLAPETRPKVARLPDPRPPPRGSKVISFLCRYGRIVPVDFSEMQRNLRDGNLMALGESRPVGARDLEWLSFFWDKVWRYADTLNWRVTRPESGQIFADVQWGSRELGASRSELDREESDYLARLRGQSPDEHFVRYYVWADSFETYLEARYLAETMGYPVSWMVLPVDEELGLPLTGPHLNQRILID